MSEYCLNTNVTERMRGRVIAIYTTFFSLSLILGPWLLTFFDLTTWHPFAFIAIILLSTTVAHQFFSQPIRDEIPQTTPLSFTKFIGYAPMIALGILFSSFYEANFLSFFPLYTLEYNYTREVGLLMASAIFIGDALAQYPIGYLADHYNRKRLQLTLAITVALLVAPLPYVITIPWLIWPWLLLLGGCAGVIYTISLIRLGGLYAGHALFKALASAGVIWSLGSFIGPWGTGIMQDFLGPTGFIFSLLIIVLILIGASLFDRVRSDKPI